MKQSLFTLSLLFIGSFLFAQSFNYQGAIRDANGNILSDESIDLRIGIYDGNNKLFEENHTNINTNSQGVFSIKIGDSNPTLLRQLDYANGLDIKTEIRSEGSFKTISLEPLSAVPIALKALSVENVEDSDADPENEIQTLYANGNTLGITGGNEIQFGGDADPDPQNEIQNLEITNSTISLSQSNQAININSAISNRSGWVSNAGIIKPLNISTSVGIGITNTPEAKLHIDGGGDASLAGGGALMIGSPSFGNLIFDNNEIIARHNGTAASLSLNKGSGATFIGEGGGIVLIAANGGGNISLGQNGGGNTLVYQSLGIGTSAPDAKIHVSSGEDVSLVNDGFIMMGTKNSENVILDNNEIQARNNGAAVALNLNLEGGGIKTFLRNIGDHRNMQYNVATKEIGYDNSSRRYKNNITTLEDDWQKILKARPVKYTRDSSPDYWEFGYVAEEMDSIGMSNLVYTNEEGLIEDFNYEKMIIYVTEMVKINHQKILELEMMQTALKEEKEKNKTLSTKFDAMQKLIMLNYNKSSKSK